VITQTLGALHFHGKVGPEVPISGPFNDLGCLSFKTVQLGSRRFWEEGVDLLLNRFRCVVGARRDAPTSQR